MYVWRYLGAADEERGTSERFDAREEAERWLAERWSDLAADDVAAVALIDEESGETLYRMRLDEADA